MHGSWRSWWILIPRGTHVVIIIIISIIVVIVVIVVVVIVVVVIVVVVIVVTIMMIIVIVTMNINVKGALISLFKFKSGFSIRKRIFGFFTKIQKRIMDPKWSTTEVASLDHIQNRILWIHDPKRFLTTDPKRVNIAKR